MEKANEECSEVASTADASASDADGAKNDDHSKIMVDATSSFRHLDHTATAAIVSSSATPPAIDTIVSSDDNLITSETGADANEKLFIDGAASAAAMPTSDRQPAPSSSPATSSTHQASSLSSQNQQQQQQQLLLQSQQQHPGVDESKIQKALSFLQNPTIRDVSNNNKRLYLERNTDLNMWEIDAAMNRIMGRNDGVVIGGVDGNGNIRDSGGNDVSDYVARGHHAHQNPSDHYNTHHHQQQQEQQHKQQRRGHPPSPLHCEDDNYHNDYNSARRRLPPPPTPSQPSLPQSQDDNEYNHWQGGRQHDPHYDDDGTNHHTDYRHHYRGWEGDGREVVTAAVGGGGGGTSSWIGGFSIGIFGLAAWRWLNGGDFVLFPPPSIVSSVTTTASSTTTTIIDSVYNGDGTKSDAVAQKEEEATSKKNVSWKDLPSCPEESRGQKDEDDCKDADQEGDTVEEESDDEIDDNDADEVEYYDDNEDEIVDSHDLHAALNRKNTHSRNYSQPPNTSFQQHQQQPPSYDELVLEIRALTSAIHSHRDSQERIARNAYNTNVGRDLTDDAMDFLRKKKKKKEENNNSNNNSGDLLKRENLSVVVVSLLKEVSDDLIELKIVMNSKPREDGDPESINEIGATEESSENGENEEEIVLEVERPTKQIDVVIEKIQKMLAIVDEKPNEIEGGNFAALEDGDVGSTNGKMGGEDDKNKSVLTVAGVDTLSAHDVERTESVVSEEVADAKNADELSVHESDERHHDNSLPTPEIFQINTVVPQQHVEQQQQLEDALRTLANSNDAQKLKVGAQMLYLYCRNISQNASVPRYRKIYTTTNTFRNKVGDLVGAKDFLVAVGFVERAKENLFEWSGNVGEGVTEATIKSKLDFALIALELMKNGERGDYSDGGDHKDAK